MFDNRYHFVHDGKKSKFYLTLPRVVRDGAQKVRAVSRSYRVGVDGTYGMERDYENAVARARAQLAGKPVGTTITLRAFGSDGSLLDHVMFRKSVSAPKVLDTNGNNNADAYWSWVVSEFKNARFAGAYVCKSIAGTSTMSQHSYGNAVDVFVDDLEKLASMAVARATEFHIEHVIVYSKIWTRGRGWTYYSGEKHYHVHVDFFPQFSGNCGVRN